MVDKFTFTPEHPKMKTMAHLFMLVEIILLILDKWKKAISVWSKFQKYSNESYFAFRTYNMKNFSP